MANVESEQITTYPIPLLTVTFDGSCILLFLSVRVFQTESILTRNSHIPKNSFEYDGVRSWSERGKNYIKKNYTQNEA